MNPALSIEDFVLRNDVLGKAVSFDVRVLFNLSRLLSESATLRSKILFVNLSAITLSYRRFYTGVYPFLKEIRDKVKGLTVEVTERSDFLCDHSARSNMELLKGNGIDVALDDVEKNMNAWKYLNAYDFDYVKIEYPFSEGLLERRELTGKGLIIEKAPKALPEELVAHKGVFYQGHEHHFPEVIVCETFAPFEL